MRIRTFVAFTGATFVPATSHVMVCVDPPWNDSPPFGENTRKGTAPTTFTWNIADPWQPEEPSDTTPPPPARLSLTVSLNFIALGTGESVSPFSPSICDGGLIG